VAAVEATAQAIILLLGRRQHQRPFIDHDAHAYHAGAEHDGVVGAVRMQADERRGPLHVLGIDRAHLALAGENPNEPHGDLGGAKRAALAASNACTPGSRSRMHVPLFSSHVVPVMLAENTVTPSVSSQRMSVAMPSLPRRSMYDRIGSSRNAHLCLG